MDDEKQAEFVKVHIHLRQATDSLHTLAAEINQMCKELEALTKDTTIRYAGLPVRVQARATLEQAEDLREALEEMGEQMRG